MYLTVLTIVLGVISVVCGSCADHLTGSTCSDAGCKWTQATPASCVVRGAGDCTVSGNGCAAAGCIYNPGETSRCQSKCLEYVDSTACTNSGSCLWNSPTSGGSCVPSVCSDESDSCLNAAGGTAGCASTSVSECYHEYFYSEDECASYFAKYGDEVCVDGCVKSGSACVAMSMDEQCNNKITVGKSECEVFTFEECKLEGGKCVPVSGSTDTDCNKLDVYPMTCEGESDDFCKQQGDICVQNTDKSVYPCAVGAGDCDRGSLDSGQCFHEDGTDCLSTNPTCTANEGVTACNAASIIAGCTYVPPSPTCMPTVACGAPLDETCTNTACEFVPAVSSFCIADPSLSCTAAVNTPCTSEQISSGCVSTAEVGMCSENDSAAFTLYVPLYFFIFIFIALLL